MLASVGESDLAVPALVEVAVVADRMAGMSSEVLDQDRYREPHTNSSGGMSSLPNL